MPSTVIRTFSYDPASAILRVEFLSGMVYHYQGVSEEVFLAMKASRSKGSYLNRYIKGRYFYKKVA